MVKLRVLIILFFVLVSLMQAKSQCVKYAVDLGSDAMPGDITISWSINTGQNSCSGFDKKEVHKHRFIITVSDIFEDIVLKDTIEQNFFRANTQLVNNTFMKVAVVEFGDPRQQFTIEIKIRKDEMPVMHSKIDSLNNYLLNGYFPNALSILWDLNRTDLMDELKSQYKVLFPDYYPHPERFLNCYLDHGTMELVKMPFVSGLKSFLKQINKWPNDANESNGFKVYATITAKNKLDEYDLMPGKFKARIENAVSRLTFDNRRGKPNRAVIIVGWSKHQKMFTIVNERALIDPDSKSFQKGFYRNEDFVPD